MADVSISSLLARWEEAFAQGRDLPAEELCPEQPGLADELRQAIDVLRRNKRCQSQAGSPATEDPYATQYPTEGGVPAAVVVMDPLCPAGYRLVKRLARGGQGVVYLARQEALDREVALKVLDRDDDPAAHVRFLADAAAIAAVRHPGIVQVHDYGTHNGVPYFALEYCAGGSLADRLAGTPLPAGEAARVVEQVAVAVQAAHDRGIVHRDLKPHNVLLCSPVSPRPDEPRVPEGRDYIPKVTDFGLAKRVEGGSGLTVTGAILGTPAYMAPEQAAGKKDVGPAADVWGLGAVLYECLTGRPPFKAATPYETLVQVIADEPVPPGRLNASTPADLETICLKCLQKEPVKRYGSARELAEDLRRFQAGEPIAARPVSSVERAVRWARRRPAIAGLLGGIVGITLTALVAISLLYANAVRAETAAQNERHTAETAREAAEDSEKRAEGERDAARKAERTALQQKQEADEQRDRAERLMYAGKPALAQEYWHDNPPAALNLLEECQRSRRGWEHRHLWTLYHSNQATFRGHIHYVSSVAFSPDGRRVASGSEDDTVKVWDAQTGQEVLAFKGHTGGINSVAFSPDGRRVASGSEDSRVKVWNPDNGQELLSLKGHTGWVQSVAFSPDGRRIASGSDDTTVKVWDAANGQEALALKGHTGWVSSVTFSSDDKQVFGQNSANKILAWDAQTGALLPNPPPSMPATLRTTAADGRTLRIRGSTIDILTPADLQRERDDNRAFLQRLADDLPAFHRARAAEGEQAKSPFAAAFHLDRLVRLQPFDADLRQRLHAALAQTEDGPGSRLLCQRAVAFDVARQLAIVGHPAAWPTLAATITPVPPLAPAPPTPPARMPRAD